MNRLKILIFGLVVIFGFYSCTDEDLILTNESDSNYTQQTVETRLDPNKSGKDEQACIVNNKAGIKCFESVGNSCKKIHACEAVTSSAINAGQFFSESELNNWMSTNYRQNRPFMIHMWEIGYFVHPDSIR
jgi:hypothetical protein